MKIQKNILLLLTGLGFVGGLQGQEGAHVSSPLLGWASTPQQAFYNPRDLVPVLADAATAAEEESPWSGNASVAMNFTDGNTNSSSQRVAGDLTHKVGKSGHTLYGEYNEGASEGKTNLRNHTLGYKYQREVSERAFLKAGFEVYKDPFKRLNRQTKSTLAAGYHVIQEEKTKFDAEAGLTYIYENYELKSSETFIGLVIAEKFNHTFDSGVEFFQEGEIIPSTENIDKVLIESVQGVRSTLTEGWTLVTQVKLTFDSERPKDELGNPILRDDGHKVRRLDAQYLVSLNYSF